MAYEYSQIIELFEMLTLREKENLIKNLQEIIVQERNAPKKSPLEVAWTDIQRNIKKLSHYSYVDDQLELIEHYKASNADKAVEIAEYGLKKCREDQTDLFLYLLQHARETGDEVKIAKLIRSAKLRRAVNYDKVQEQFDQGIPRH